MSTTASDSILVSVIIPIYNTQDTILKLINNLQQIKCDNIEFIFVNDGSRDNSLHILQLELKKWGEKYQYKIIDKQNGGLSDARNTGLKSANGDFIWFVDSDDLINVESVKTIYKFLQLHLMCDLVVFPYRIFENEAEIIQIGATNQGQFHEISSQELLTKLFLRKIDNYSWSFIASKRIYIKNHITFPVGKNFEDYATTYKVFANSSNPVFFSKITYFYRYRQNSIVHDPGKLVANAKDILFHGNNILNEFNNSLLARQFVLSFLLYAINSLQENQTDESIDLIKSIDKQIRMFCVNNFPIKKRIIILLYKVNLYKVVKRWKLKNILLTFK